VQEADMTTERGETLAARLKSLRAAAGLTQQALATQAGLSMSLVTQLEYGLRSDPKLSTLQALARVLNVTLDQLAGGLTETPPAPEPKRRPRR
jgi:transcriptional regulator with XRE-family HTH domain